ncbi:uncharacterized protein LOC134199861 [Bombyx mori]|uniref:uncharacterized protein LOC134199861 n=1 Tax=Bombyx mori TaxID=7091 RepID=UPI002ED50F2C
MITYVVHGLNLFSLLIQNIVNFAALIGKFILLFLIYVSSAILETKNSIKLFFEIVYEDNFSTFAEDLPNCVCNFKDATVDHFLYLGRTIVSIYYDIYSRLTSTVTTTVQTIGNVFVNLSEVLLIFSKCIIFLGDTVWLMLTFIPVHLPQLVKVMIRYTFDTAINVTVDAYMNLLNFTNFLTDVPLQSFAGLTISILIARLTIHYWESILSHLHIYYWSLVRNVIYFYYAIVHYISNSEVRIITQIANGEDIETRNMSFEIDEDPSSNQSDSLCVICQERQKCVLTLPCRHICLCTECCRRLYGYQRTCPICRTFIYHSVTVYL